MKELPFSQKYELAPAETEIRAWLKKNRTTLLGRDASEVAHLAVLCGFDLSDVCMTLSNFEDAKRGSHIENRAAFQTWRLEMAIDDCNKLKKKLEPRELDLMPLWADLVANTVTGVAA